MDSLLIFSTVFPAKRPDVALVTAPNMVGSEQTSGCLVARFAARTSCAPKINLEILAHAELSQKLRNLPAIKDLENYYFFNFA